VKLALRALLVAVVAAVVTQSGAAAPVRMRLAITPDSFLLWNQHDGLLGVGRCDVAHDVHEGECVSGAVERTSDGGRTYHVVFRTRKPIGYLRTVGTNGAVATTYGNHSWLTLDRGRTWRHVPSRPTVDWLTSRIGVSFRSYAVGNQGELALRVTQDGGRTWERKRDPCQQAIAFDAFADLVTPKQWWVACVGEGGAGNEEKAIFRTRDGGATWQAGAATLAYPKLREHGGISMYGYPEQLAFAPNGFGLLTESRGTLYLTRDGGLHFNAEPKVARPEVDFAGGAAVFAGGIGYVLLAAGPEPRIVETRDSGRTWHVVRRWSRG
jgi:photosystem II stability/assembly factor-like uncharacterized protein